MFKIIGRLLGMEYEEIKYNREILGFMILGAMIFFFLGINHAEEGAKFLYTNKLTLSIMCKAENDGISNEVLEKSLSKFEEAIPINIREYELYDIKDRLENFIFELRNEKNDSLNSIIFTLEGILETENKESLISKLNNLDLKGMFTKVSREEIVMESLQKVAERQTNIFLSLAYFIIATLLAFASIIIKVVCDIKFIEKKNKQSSWL